ncbi:MAG TPA: methyltransferase domain-containing protein [Nocardioides sp.]|nr:methyltransferase domain-containing protein [Nocardioides sp.]
MSSGDPVRQWNAEAATFDEAADHGLRDPAVREAWRGLLLSLLPASPARVADLGCGTGTLTLLLAGEGYAVDGVDFSPEMIRRARAKLGASPAAGVTFAEADAERPPLEVGAYDAVLCRHVLWAMTDPAATLRRWVALLVPGGRLVLVEGRWSTGALRDGRRSSSSGTTGLAASRTVELVEAVGREAELTMLPEATYWAREIDDERYVVVSRR